MFIRIISSTFLALFDFYGANQLRRIAIFHYHLLPGGVTSVIILSVQAVLKYLPDIEKIILVSGKAENAMEVRNKIVAGFDNLDKEKVEVRIVPQIGYANHGERVNEERTVKIEKILMQEFGGYLWWVHNYHIGKNPFLTQALLNIAVKNPSQKIIFHIHDFPECSRYENLQFLKEHTVPPIYLNTGNIRYVVINTRDYALLVASGLSAERVFLLHNPVDPFKVDLSSKPYIREKLQRVFSSDSASFYPDKPFVLYPVRAIRRKNILESGLISSLLEEPVNLVVTLPGVSEQEKEYSALVKTCYNEGLITGLFNIGNKLDAESLTLTDIIASSDVVISSSIQEGFGYLFINAPGWGLPLFARYLDILDGIRDFFSDLSCYFYREILIPLTENEKGKLLKRYRERIRYLSELISGDSLNRLTEEIEALLSSKVIDFSYLDAEYQYFILKTINKDSSFCKEVKLLNNETIDQFRSLLYAEQPPAEEKIIDAFGMARFARSAEEVFNSLERESERCHEEEISHHLAEDQSDPVQEYLMDRFARREYLRLLYE